MSNADGLADPAHRRLGMHTPPFPPTPDAEHYFHTEWLQARQAEAAHCLASGKGFILLTGEIGTGMSTFLRQLLAALAGGAFVLGCAGFGEGLAARGYVDVLWAGTATAGAVAALCLPPGRRAAALATACFAAAALTKGDGLVTVVAVLVPLAAARWWWLRRRAALPWVAAAGAAALAGLAWPVLVSRYTAVGNASINADSVRTLLGGDPDAVGRIRPTLAELWAFARPTALGAAAVLVAGALLVVARRRGPAAARAPLALGPGWLAAAAVGAFGMMAFVFAAGVHDLGWWLMTAGQRTMTVVRTLLLAEVLVWAVLALDLVLAGGRRAVPAEAPAPAPGGPGARPAEPAQSSV